MSSKKRPTNVPDDAWWEEAENEWVLGELKGVKREGNFQFWRPDGTLVCECLYKNGQANGPYKRFHENGEVSQAGELVDNKRHGECSYTRSTAQTSEVTFPPQTPANVWSARSLIERGVVHSTRYYDQNGKEVDADGEAARVRPDGVPESANWNLAENGWLDGSLIDGTQTRVGKSRWWTASGQLMQEVDYDDQGEVTNQTTHNHDGTLKQKKTALKDGGNERLNYHDNGVLFTKTIKNADGKKTYEGRWSNESVLREEITTEWQNGQIYSRTELGPEGILLLKVKPEHNELHCTLFYENANKQAEGLVANGKFTGVWQTYTEDGTPSTKLEIQNIDVEAPLKADRLPWAISQAAFDLLHDPKAISSELAGIDDISWAELEGAYCDDLDRFPTLLRALVHNEPLVRSYALGCIESETEHQGSVYEATAKVLPFFIRLLAHKNADRKSLLAAIYLAASNSRAYENEALEAKNSGEDEPWITAILGSVAAASQGWPTFRRLLSDSDPEIVRQAILFAAFAEDVDAARADLKEIIENKNRHPETRACAAQALVEVPKTETKELLLLCQNDELFIRATGAIAIGLNYGPESPAEVVTVLGEVVKNWQAIADDYHNLPFVDEHILGVTALAIGSIRSLEARQLIQPLCTKLHEVDAYSAVTYGRGLMALAFGSGELPFADDFILVLETLATSENFWRFNVNAHEVLDAWNMPREAEALKEFVTKIKSAPDPEQAVHTYMHNSG